MSKSWLVAGDAAHAVMVAMERANSQEGQVLVLDPSSPEHDHRASTTTHSEASASPRNPSSALPTLNEGAMMAELGVPPNQPSPKNASHARSRSHRRRAGPGGRGGTPPALNVCRIQRWFENSKTLNGVTLGALQRFRSGRLAAARRRPQTGARRFLRGVKEE